MSPKFSAKFLRGDKLIAVVVFFLCSHLVLKIALLLQTPINCHYLLKQYYG